MKKKELRIINFLNLSNEKYMKILSDMGLHSE